MLPQEKAPAFDGNGCKRGALSPLCLSTEPGETSKYGADQSFAQIFSKIPSSLGQHDVQELRFLLPVTAVHPFCYSVWCGEGFAVSKVVRTVLNTIWSKEIIFFPSFCE